VEKEVDTEKVTGEGSCKSFEEMGKRGFLAMVRVDSAEGAKV